LKKKRSSQADATQQQRQGQDVSTEKHGDLGDGVYPPPFDKSVLPNGPPLVVNVYVRFTDSNVTSNYSRSYGSSPTFEPSDKICNGLLRRIEHCSEELVTRRDSAALTMRSSDGGSVKPLRFEMTFRIFRKSTGEWAERTFRSYQKQPLTVDFSKEVILATHRMIGLFLRRHDRYFRWLDGTVRDASGGPDTEDPPMDGPLSPNCIPRSRFIEASQSFEFVPGYTIEVAFRSIGKYAEGTPYAKVLKIKSRQNSPLNVFLSEDLLWQSLQSIHSAMASKKKEFDEKHGKCEGLEGAYACQHYDDEAVYVGLRISNNLGPLFNHLQREFRSRLRLFTALDSKDCEAFLSELESQLGAARDGVDYKINNMNDFELRLVELKSSTWSLQHPAKFCLDSTASYSRRSIEAVLERVQTGVSDVLRGHDVSLHITAYKRGHLVLDKALVARAELGKAKSRAGNPDEEKEEFVCQLKTRIQMDIDKVCKDTCSLDDLPDDLLQFNAAEHTLKSKSDEQLRQEEEMRFVQTPTSDMGDETPSCTLWESVRRQQPMVSNTPLIGALQVEQKVEIVSEDNQEAGNDRGLGIGGSGEFPAPGSTPNPSSRASSVLISNGSRFFPLVPEKFDLSDLEISGKDDGLQAGGPSADRVIKALRAEDAAMTSNAHDDFEARDDLDDETQEAMGTQGSADFEGGYRSRVSTMAGSLAPPSTRPSTPDFSMGSESSPEVSFLVTPPDNKGAAADILSGDDDPTITIGQLDLAEELGGIGVTQDKIPAILPHADQKSSNKTTEEPESPCAMRTRPQLVKHVAEVVPAPKRPPPSIPIASQTGVTRLGFNRSGSAESSSSEDYFTPLGSPDHLGPSLLSLSLSPVITSIGRVHSVFESSAQQVAAPSARGSVEDFPTTLPTEEQQDSGTGAAEKDYRPATAGLLGLYETKPFEAGLRRGRGGSRPLSLPLDQLLDRSSDTTSSYWSASKGDDKTVDSTKTRRPNSSGVLLSERQSDSKRRKAGNTREGESMLPKMMMIFAGVAFANKIFNKSGN
jgi:hypothetical protein